MRMRQPREIGTDLQQWLNRQGLSEADLALKLSKEIKGLSISQSWVSRILNGRFRRLTPTIRRVAAYANIPVTRASPPDTKGAELIDKAVTEVWNGSLTHANVIARLIRVAKGIGTQE
jgi:transcriptional regulator with XRE-family HTH domain